MGKDKPSVIKGLEILLKKDVEISAVVAQPHDVQSFSGEKLIDFALKNGLNVLSEEELYNLIENPSSNSKIDLKNTDLVISFLFWKIIKKPLINFPNIGCINLHPAPLPDFRGFSPYCFAIYQNSPIWGVTAHFVDEKIDTGDIIQVNKFSINAKNETAFSLEQKSQIELLKLFEEIIDMSIKTNTLPRTKQSKGKYFSKKDFENLRKIENNSEDEIEKKIRAFWYPPYEGAYTTINKKEYTIINKKILDEIGKNYHKYDKFK